MYLMQLSVWVARLIDRRTGRVLDEVSVWVARLIDRRTGRVLDEGVRCRQENR